ncbi:MAG: amidohydrolase, partial [Candidatus Acidiferrales bacterium]
MIFVKTHCSRFLVVLAVAALVPLVVRAQAQDDSNVTVIKNATILTITHGRIEHGSIVIRDGKIADVGADVQSPAGAKVIDGTGLYVMPGIIDCHTHIAVDGDVNEGSISVSSMVNIKDVMNPYDVDIYHELAGGVVIGNVLHGSANPIGG